MKMPDSPKPLRTNVGLIEGEQLDWLAPPEPPMARLRRLIENAGHCRPEIKLNRNRLNWITIKPASASQPVRLSIHQAFLHAPDQVILAIGGIINGDRREHHHLIQDYIDQASQSDEVIDRHKRRATKRARTRGRVYDVGQVLKDISREYFPGHGLPAITWGRNRPLARHVTLGSYSDEEKMIRIHPVLDDERVPPEYVRYVVFHEMLHHVLPAEKSNGGRRVIHSAEFLKREQEFSQFDEAQNFEKKLFRRLGRRRLFR